MFKHGNYKKLDIFYSHLSIIDSKITAILSINAILFVGVSIWFPKIENLYVVDFLIIAAIVIAIISTIICFGTCNIYWSNLNDLKNIKKHLVRLYWKRYKRTFYLKAAMILSIISMLLFFIGILLNFYFNTKLKQII